MPIGTYAVTLAVKGLPDIRDRGRLATGRGTFVRSELHAVGSR